MKRNVNVDIRLWKIWSRFLFVCQAILVCVYGGLSLCNFWNSEDVHWVRARNTGMLVSVLGALPFFLGAVGTCVRLDRQKVKFMIVVYMISSAVVMFLSAYHLVKIYEFTQTWTDVLTISTVLMSFYAILMIVQCVFYGYIINTLPKEETYDSIPVETN